MAITKNIKIFPLLFWLLFLGSGCLILACVVGISQDGDNTIALYCLVVFGILFLSTVFAIAIAYFLFIPRIKEIASVLQVAGRGNFNVRVRESARGDELGNCSKQVNLLISTIQEYIGRLHELNRVGEELANALTRDEVVRVVIETVENQLDGKCVGLFEWNVFVRKTDRAEQHVEILNQEKIDSLFEGRTVTVKAKDRSSNIGSLPIQFLYVPVVEQNVTTSVMVFQGRTGDILLTPVAGEFAGTLSRLTSNAFSRIHSIHELTRAESKYRALFMMMQGGIFRINSSGKFEDINPALAAMGGYDSVDEMLSLIQDISEVYADPCEQQKLKDALERDGRTKGMGLQLRRKDGTTFPVLISAHVVRNEEGEIAAIEGNVVDMTERVLREEAERENAAVEAANRVKSEMLDDLEAKNQQLRETLEEMRMMQKQLLQSEKMATVGTMAAGVAHDLNNILAGSVSYPDLMMVQLPEESELRKPLAEIKKSGMQAVDIINDLLLLSKGTSRGIAFKELNQLLKSCFQSLDVVQLLERNPNLQFDSRLCSETVYLRCTFLHVQKAIVNLLVSGLETAGEKGYVAVGFELTEVEHDGLDSLALREGLYAILTITFNDSSVKKEHYSRIFDPFYFSSIAGNNSAKNGLSLTVAWNLIQEHEGTVVAESSDDGSGSFKVYLPVTREAEVSENIDDYFADDLRGSGTVLVVDDEPLQRDITGRMLTELGYQAYLVASGERALDFIEKRAVDLVLLDMLMPPGMNGRETYEKILEISPNQKALVISGFTNSKDIEKTLALGAGRLLKKPYSLAQLGYAVMTELS